MLACPPQVLVVLECLVDLECVDAFLLEVLIFLQLVVVLLHFLRHQVAQKVVLNLYLAGALAYVVDLACVARVGGVGPYDSFEELLVAVNCVLLRGQAGLLAVAPAPLRNLVSGDVDIEYLGAPSVRG